MKRARRRGVPGMFWFSNNASTSAYSQSERHADEAEMAVLVSAFRKSSVIADEKSGRRSVRRNGGRICQGEAVQEEAAIG